MQQIGLSSVKVTHMKTISEIDLNGTLGQSTQQEQNVYFSQMHMELNQQSELLKKT